MDVTGEWEHYYVHSTLYVVIMESSQYEKQQKNNNKNTHKQCPWDP